MRSRQAASPMSDFHCRDRWAKASKRSKLRIGSGLEILLEIQLGNKDYYPAGDAPSDRFRPRLGRSAAFGSRPRSLPCATCARRFAALTAWASASTPSSPETR